MDINNKNIPIWKPMERSIKSIGPNGEMETTTYSLGKDKKMTVEGIKIAAGLLALITPFLLLFIQRNNELKSDKQEKLSDTYVQFSKDLNSLMEKTTPDTAYVSIFDNIKTAYKTKFKLFGSKSVNAYVDSIYQFIHLRNAVIELKQLSDSVLLKYSSSVLLNLGRYYVYTGISSSSLLGTSYRIKFDNVKDSILNSEFKSYNAEAGDILDNVRIWKMKVSKIVLFRRSGESLGMKIDFSDKNADTSLAIAITENKSLHGFDTTFIRFMITFDTSLSKVRNFLSRSVIRIGGIRMASLEHRNQALFFTEPYLFIRNRIRSFQIPFLRARVNHLHSKLDSCVLKQLGSN